MNYSPRFSLRLAAALALAAPMALCPANARADSTVFSSLGPGDTYSMSSGNNVRGANTFPGGNTIQLHAAQFTAGASGFLGTVDLGLTKNSSFGGPVSVFLYGNASGLPDNANQAFLGTGSPTAAFNTTNNSLLSLMIAGNVPVTMGTVYWLVLKPADPNTSDIWNIASPTVAGASAESNDGSTWFSVGNPYPAFRLTARDAAGVPDSGSTWMLLLLGVTAILGLNVFARRPVRA